LRRRPEFSFINYFWNPTGVYSALKRDRGDGLGDS
jgi:hypothetical protein